ncbi:MAG: MarR family transcriptional regulator [bacterium]|nr:MarR family transcriptional regulator [bacterium]
MSDQHSDTALKLDNRTLRLWLRLLGCTKLIENAIRGRLRESFAITLPRFDVMAQLYRYPEGLRMGELSTLLMVTGGNITGIIDQLVEEGLVERMSGEQDRRVYTARLTTAGKDAFEMMAVEHREWVGGLLDGLTDDEQQQLSDLLAKMKDGLHEKLDH